MNNLAQFETFDEDRYSSYRSLFKPNVLEYVASTCLRRNSQRICDYHFSYRNVNVGLLKATPLQAVT